MSSFLILLAAFAGALFLLLNGPLWVSGKLSARVPAFAHGPEAPRWLEKVGTTASRVGGIVVMLFWLTTASQGNILHACLLAFIFAVSAFFILRGSWLAKRSTVAPGGVLWFTRLVGIGAALEGFHIVFLLSAESFG